MLKEEMDDRPEEVTGAAGLQKKSRYLQEMDKLE
jgi:hypothetical protein